MTAVHKIKIGNEEYVPKLPENKNIFQKIRPRPGVIYGVINFSDYVATPYSKLPESSKTFLRVEVEDVTGNYPCIIDSAKLAKALGLPNAQEVDELAQRSKLVQKIQEITVEGERKRKALFDQTLRRFYSVYSTSAEVRKAVGEISTVVGPVIRAGVRKFYRSSLSEYNSQVHYHVIEIQKVKKLVILLNEENGSRLICIENYIEEGSIAHVFKVKSVLDRMDLALKVAKSNDVARRRIDKEFEIYKQLFGNLPPGAHITGLQMNCYGKLDDLPLTAKGRIAIVDDLNLTCGLLLPFYCFGDLFSFVTNRTALNLKQLKMGWKENGCYQLLMGAGYLEEQGKVQVDTCLENTFVTESHEEGFLQFDLCDLEGIISFKTYRESRSPIHHRASISLAEFTLMTDCLADSELFKQHMEKVAPKAAAFSLTTVLFGLLTQRAFNPLEQNEKSLYLDLAKEKPRDRWVGLEKENKELASLFESTLFKEYSFRYTPKQLLERFHELMKVQNPQLYQKYDQQVKALLQSKPPEPVEEKGKAPNAPI
ncbi:MAG TPA: hypothetical protein VLG76_02500 [Rhabdochlamydiaceae bacterium]|nr:hypothetical protein [Rhabdochlamydiaceae bacterium]